MKITIDIQPAITQRAGVGRYTKQLVQHLGKYAGNDSIDLAYFDFRRNAAFFPAPNTSHKAVRCCPGRLAQFLWKKISWPPYDLFMGKSDLYHFPNFIVPPLAHGKSVVTIHDMSFIRHPSFAEDSNLHYLADRINDTVVRADAIITDSKFSANEIHSLLDVNPEKIFPIYLGVDQDIQTPDPAAIASTLYKLKTDRPYLLTVGTLEPRKNIPFLIEVFEKMSDFRGSLVIAGMPGWKYEPILERIKRSTRSRNIRYVRYVDDPTLAALYAGAELFITSSVYEGFGLPPLEAMSLGTPVVSSAGGSLPEILGSAALIINGFEPLLWKEKIIAFLEDSQARQDMVDRARKHVEKYTWDRTAEQTWKVYRSLVQ